MVRVMHRVGEVVVADPGARLIETRIVSPAGENRLTVELDPDGAAARAGTAIPLSPQNGTEMVASFTLEALGPHDAPPIESVVRNLVRTAREVR